MKLRICVVMLALAQSCPPLWANSEAERETLVGIAAVHVTVEDLPPGAAALGLTGESIQTDVELKLRLAGMQVAKVIEPSVYVAVNISPDARAASVDLEVHQGARLIRAPAEAFLVTTWSSGGVISNPTAVGIRNYVKDLIDKFLNDWLSVNPRPTVR